jgi:hypothetical protein
MTSEKFSGFNAITISDPLKQRILGQIETMSIVAPKKKKTAFFAAITACLILLVITGSIFASQMFGGTIYSNNKFRIIDHAPTVLPFGSHVQEHSIAVAPSEDELYSTANVILYGEVESFKWVVLKQESDALSRYRTIVTVKVLNIYSGRIQAGQTIDILLPISISGTGTGTVVEDNENACKLKKGSEAFFFTEEYGNEDTVMDGSSLVQSKDICQYGTGWGNQYIILNENGKFNYPFAQTQGLSFKNMEDIIKSKAR